MEVVASASGIIAIVSVAIQLAETVQKLVDFLKTVENAPDDIKALSQDLEQLSSILKQSREVNRSLKYDEVTEAVLRTCETRISKLRDKIEPLAKSLKSSSCRKRALLSIKVVSQNKEIESARLAIESAISSLRTVQSTNLLYLQVQTRQDINRLERSVASLSSTILRSDMRARAVKPDLKDPTDILSLPIAPLIYPDTIQNPSQHPKVEASSTFCLPACPPTRSSAVQKRKQKAYWAALLRTPGVDIKIWHQTVEVSTQRISDQTTRKAITNEAYYVIYPNAIGRFIGLAQGVMIRSSQFPSPQHSFETFRAVPQDSLIFQFCIDGNVSAIRRLFERGEASPLDRDPSGRTPLWFAAKYLQPDVAKLLLDEGANPHAIDWHRRKEPIFAIAESPDSTNVESKIAMINLLQKNKHEDYLEETLRNMIGRFIINYRPQKDMSMLWKDRRRALLGFISSLLPDYGSEDPMVSAFLEEIIRFYYDGEILQYILRMIKVIDIVDPMKSILHRAIWLRLPERDATSFKQIVQKTKTSQHHLPAFIRREANRPETPTMIALYDINLFLKWRAIIKELGYQASDFVFHELEEKPVAEAGWNNSSLMFLFNEDFEEEPDSAPRLFGFPACERCGDVGTKIGDALRVDLKWRRTLRCIRRHFRHDPSETSVSTSDTLDIMVTASLTTTPSNTLTFTKPDEIRQNTFLGDETPAEKLPYRMVCSEKCKDGVCVAWLYENDLMEEVELPLFPVRPPRVVEDDIKETGTPENIDCPTVNMPGSFKETE